jgi:hypothetical protein
VVAFLLHRDTAAGVQGAVQVLGTIMALAIDRHHGATLAFGL